MAAPPSETGAVKATESCVSPASIDEMVGAPGAAKGAFGVPLTAADAVPGPTEFLARILT